MKPKSLLILFLITLGILSYVYFAIEKPAKDKELSEGKEDRLAPEDMSLVQSFKLTIGELKIELQRQKVGWRILTPIQDIAAQNRIENLVTNLEKLKKTRVLYTPEKLAEAKPDLTQFGLNPPKVILEYKTSEQSVPSEIQLGSQTPSGNLTYVLTKSHGLSIGTMDLDFLSTQNPDDFREMRISTVTPSDYDEVEVTRGSQKIKFTRENDQWVMNGLYHDLPIDKDFVSNYIEKISFMRANKFYTSSPAVMQKPDIKILVGFKEGVSDLRTTESDTRPKGTEIWLVKRKNIKYKPSSKKDSATSAPEEEFEYFVKSEKTQAASIAKFHYDNFDKSPEDFIKKTFDNFLISDLTEVSIRPAKGKALTLTKGASGFEVKGDSSQTLDQTKVENAFNKLRSLRAVKFVGVEKNLPKTSSFLIVFNAQNQKTYEFAFLFEANATHLWYKSGDKTLKYIFAKDALNPKDFELMNLKASVQTSDSTAANALQAAPKQEKHP